MTVAAILGILFGAVVVVAGALAIVFRVRLANWNARVNRSSFGQYGERVAKSSTPFVITIVGIGLILVGVVTLLRVAFPGGS